MAKAVGKTATLPTVSVPDSSPDLIPGKGTVYTLYTVSALTKSSLHLLTVHLTNIGEVLVGLAPNTQQLLYESDSSDKVPGYINGTLYVTNHKLSFKPTIFLTDKVRGDTL